MLSHEILCQWNVVWLNKEKFAEIVSGGMEVETAFDSRAQAETLAASRVWFIVSACDKSMPRR